ncbi:U32 family peptidase [Fusibacter bizertensis]
MRFFNNKKIELLAPAGNFEIFKSIVESKCDAVYFGGQRMNMRMIRKGFNFTDEELKLAVELAREKNKSTYITVNNLLDEADLEALDAYLLFLDEIKPTGIIVQDMAVLSRANKLNLGIEIHASVMMNVHNLEMIHALEEKGVNRVVLSRETTLAEASYFHQNSQMEFEYFTHGDMCVAHGAQCYYSAMLFGMSSNRGKCLKPCRWWFDFEGSRSYPLAVKDMSMIANLPQMIHAGITSFKIEGRMREKDFIVDLINRYGDVLDRYIEDPIGYDYKAQEAWIYEHRKRDLSTAYAFGVPGLSNINERYEGTGKFYSTGKMFSTPTEESKIEPHHLEQLWTVFDQESVMPEKLSVRVEDMDQVTIALEEGVDRIYLASDVFEPKHPFTFDDVIEITKIKGETELFIALPRMMDELQFENYGVWLEKISQAGGKVDGLLVTNLGAVRTYAGKGYKLVGDFSLNIFNQIAAKFYLEQGVEVITPSIELPAKELKALLNSSVPCEVITHGRLSMMYMSHDLYDAQNVSTDDILVYENEGGKYVIKRDVHGKSHLLMQKHYTLLPVADRLTVKSIRIEAQNETPDALRSIIRAHQAVMNKEISGMDSLKSLGENHLVTLGATRF